MLPLVIVLLADSSGTPIISDWGTWIGAAGLVISAAIVKVKDLAQVFSDIKMKWYTATTAQDAIVVIELKAHIALLKQEQTALKEDIIDLRSSQTYSNHVVSRYAVQEEKLWGYITLLYDYAGRLVNELKEQGVSVEPPPPMPERQEPGPANDGFQARTKATNAKLAAAAAALVVPVPVPSIVPSTTKGQGQP